MGTLNMHRMFNPKSIAVIGAGERQGRIGAAIMNNLLKGEFPGEVYPVNPKYDAVMGLPCFPHVTDIKEPVDMAIIATPIKGVPDIVDACSNAGLAGAVIISSGGKEMGAAGRRIEMQIMEKAKKKQPAHHWTQLSGYCEHRKKILMPALPISRPYPEKLPFFPRVGLYVPLSWTWPCVKMWDSAILSAWEP